VVGSVGSENVLDTILLPQFSDGGDFLGSELTRAFGIGYDDEVLLEAGCSPVEAAEPPRHLAVLDRGAERLAESRKSSP
jgi:hypothetical protein